MPGTQRSRWCGGRCAWADWRW